MLFVWENQYRQTELLPSEWTSEINKFTLNLEGSNFYA